MIYMQNKIVILYTLNTWQLSQLYLNEAGKKKKN